MSESSLGDWTLHECLGTGGMGRVFRAVHRDGRIAALKQLSADHPTAVAALETEIGVLSRLRHPGIVRILDHGVAGTRPWYAMELIDGPSLQERWSSLRLGRTTADTMFPHPDGDEPVVAPQPNGSPNGRAEALASIRAVCDPLAWLHGMGVVHADLKPANVLLRADGRVVLADFGISTSTSSSLREVLELRGARSGTAACIAPERIRGDPIDARADIYAIGCMLYLAVTGAPPFVGPLTNVLHGHVLDRPRPPSDSVDIEDPLEQLILTLLAKDPRDRPSRVEDVAATLDDLGIAGATADVVPPRPWLYRPPFAGRAAVKRALLDSPAWVSVVFGPEGIGRTRLLTEVGQELLARGGRVEAASCRPDASIAVLSRARAELPREASREAVGREVQRVVASSGSDVTVLLLDDLHRADEPTLGLVAWLLDARPSGLRVVASALDAGSEAVRRLLGAPSVERHALYALSDDEATDAALGMLGLRRGATSAVAAQVATATGGHPRHLVEALRLALDEGALVREGGVWTVDAAALDRGPDEVLQRRLAPLAEQDVLRAAAVAGAEVDLDLLLALGFPREEADDAIAAALRANVLERGPLAFASERVRGGLLATIPADELRDLHRRVLAVLELRQPPDVGRLAEHALAAGDLRCGELLVQAASAATARGAHRECLRLCQLALPHLDAAGRFAAHGVAFLTALHEGDLDRLAVIAEAAAADARTAVEIAEAQRLLGVSHWRSSRPAQARIAFETAITGAPEGSLVLGRAYVGLIALAVETGQNEEGRRLVALALAAHDRVDDPRFLALLHANAAILDHTDWRPAAAEEHYRLGIEAARRVGDRRIASTGLTNLGTLLVDRGDLDGAKTVLREAIAEHRLIGNRRMHAVSLAQLGTAHARAGQIDDAELCFDEALALMAHDRRITAMLGIQRVHGRRLCGWFETDAAIAALVAVLEEFGDKPNLVECAVERAYLALERGLDAAEHLREAERQAEGLPRSAVRLVDELRIVLSGDTVPPI